MTQFEIAPILKGLSFDGEKGDIVVSKARIDYAELTCTAANSDVPV